MSEWQRERESKIEANKEELAMLEDVDLTLWEEVLTAMDKVKGEDSGFVSCSMHSVTAHFLTYIVSDMEEVRVMLVEIGKLGWRQSDEPYNNPAKETRNYVFTQGESSKHFFLDFAFNGSCHFEQVGEESVTKPVWELKCD